MTSVSQPSPAAKAPPTDSVEAELAAPGAFIYHHLESDQIAVFTRRGGTALPVRALAPRDLTRLLAANAIMETTRTDRGVRYLRASMCTARAPASSAQRSKTPARTAAEAHKPAALQAKRYVQTEGRTQPTPIKVNLGESPLGWLSRRKNARGQPFLSHEQVTAGERLRADFEFAQMGPSVTQDWRRFLSAGVESSGRGDAAQANRTDSADAAKERVLKALSALGPDLSDAVFRTCCFLEGLESIERDLDWSARSGKIVLRIALQRLVQHYEQVDSKNCRNSA